MNRIQEVKTIHSQKFKNDHIKIPFIVLGNHIKADTIRQPWKSGDKKV